MHDQAILFPHGESAGGQAIPHYGQKAIIFTSATGYSTEFKKLMRTLSTFKSVPNLPEFGRNIIQLSVLLNPIPLSTVIHMHSLLH